MGLSYTDWMTEIEDAIVSHIDTYVPTDVDVIVEVEIERPLTKPVITIANFDGDSRPSGGMNHVGLNEQGEWEMPSYLITVNTDDNSGGRNTRNAVAAELEKRAFRQYVHLLKAATGATWVWMRPAGMATGGGPTGDDLMYQSQFILDIQVLVSYPSVVL